MCARIIGVLALSMLLAVPALAQDDAAAVSFNKGLAWLAGQQQDDGAFGKRKGARVGYTALVIQAWNVAPQKVKEQNPDFSGRMEKAAVWLAGQQQPEGFIADGPEYHNYSTSLAVEALASYDRARFEPVVSKAAAYLKELQATETRKFDKDKHLTYGGFGYGSTLRPDLSNTWFALSALKAAGVEESDPVWSKAVIYIKRCQNSSEVNDQPYAGDDGGAMYLPNDSTAGTMTSRDGKTVNKSFGSMTAAMLSSYLLCGEKADALPVSLAAKWLGENFSVKENPNHNKEGMQGLFYYYRTLSAALTQYGKDDFFGHDWKKLLAAQLVSLQSPEGFWVNTESRFNENDPVLCTSYALVALGRCF